MINYTTHLSTLTAHYDKLFKHPGWKDYVAHQTEQMAKECPDLYAELAARYRPQQKSSAARRSGGR